MNAVVKIDPTLAETIASSIVESLLDKKAASQPTLWRMASIAGLEQPVANMDTIVEAASNAYKTKTDRNMAKATVEALAIVGEHGGKRVREMWETLESSRGKGKNKILFSDGMGTAVPYALNLRNKKGQFLPIPRAVDTTIEKFSISKDEKAGETATKNAEGLMAAMLIVGIDDQCEDLLEQIALVQEAVNARVERAKAE